MLVNGDRAFAIKCNKCGKFTIHKFNVFEMSKSKRLEFRCTCGELNGVIKTKDFKSFWIEVHCYACQDTHTFKYTLKNIISGNKIFRCIEGMEICIIGNNDDVEKLVERSEKDFEDILSELEFYDYFVNYDIMASCLNRIKELCSEGNVACDCGSDEIKVQVFPDRIELRCSKCDSIQMIYAETDEDLYALMTKDKIVMHKHGFVCIDAINQNHTSEDIQYKKTDE